MTYGVRGFDIAEVNRDNRGRRIDWKAVGEAGEVQFCGIRVLDGALDDLDGEYNCNGAVSIGLPFLPYQPFYPRVDAKLQARLFADRIRSLGVKRAAGDFEVHSNLPPNEYLKLAAVYVNEFEQVSGLPMTMYTGVWFGEVFVLPLLKGRDLWISNPYTPNRPNLPAGITKWRIWQDAWNKSFAGIFDPTVDSDVWNGTYDELLAWFGVEGAEPAPVPATARMRVTASALNVRSAPIVSAETARFTARRGQTFDVEQIEGDWVQVKLWMHRDYLEEI